MRKACELCGSVYSFSGGYEDASVVRRGICAECFRKGAVDAALVIFRNAVEYAPDLRSKLFLYGLLMFGARKVLRAETSRKWGAMWRMLKEKFAR